MAQDVAAILRNAGALLEGHFLLTSGRHSGTYIEKFRLLEYPSYAQELCRYIADHFRPLNVQLVAGPTTGGIIISYEVAKQLGVRGIFAEKTAQGRAFGRGFRVSPGERTLIVDDVLTTGGSIREVLTAVRRAGGQPVGVAVLIDRTGGHADFDLPFFACLTLDVASYDPADCPLCTQQLPLTET